MINLTRKVESNLKMLQISDAPETDNKLEYEMDTGTGELTFNTEEDNTAAKTNEENNEDDSCLNL